MALILTSTARRAALVFTGDDGVRLRPDVLQRRLTLWKLQQHAAAEAALPDDADDKAKAELHAQVEANLQDVALPRAWVPADECESTTGATIANVRALSWLEDQEVQALPPAQQIARAVELGLVDLDGSLDVRAAFLKAPPAPLFAPLYRAICTLTWGN